MSASLSYPINHPWCQGWRDNLTIRLLTCISLILGLRLREKNPLNFSPYITDVWDDLFVNFLSYQTQGATVSRKPVQKPSLAITEMLLSPAPLLRPGLPGFCTVLWFWNGSAMLCFKPLPLPSGDGARHRAMAVNFNAKCPDIFRAICPKLPLTNEGF